MISSNLKKRIYTSIILFLLIYLMVSFNIVLAYSLIVLGILSILEFLNITKKFIKNIFYIFMFNSIFIFYIFIFCFLFFFFSNFVQLKIILISLLLGCIASDMGGFIFGKIFKGPKLTKISPNKTFSGACGSIFFTALVMGSSMFYFTKNFSYMFLIVSFVTSLACQCGDLLFSLLKRKAKIKDTGNFLPGHGGILDRLDGILLGIPIGFISIIIIF